MQLSPETLRLLGAMALRTRRASFGIRQGSHRSQRRGHGVEFAEYRNYEAGDNPRYIDWNLFARSDKLLVKRYLEEENVALHIVIDGSRSLTHPALRQKWELATYIAAFTSYIALANQDPVTISVLGGAHSPRYWGAKAFYPLSSFLTKSGESIISSEPRTLNLLEEARRAAARVSFPGICLFISDFLYPLEQVALLLASFRARNMELHAVQVLHASDLNPAPESAAISVTDSETGEQLGVMLDSEARNHYQHLITQHNRRIREHCLSNQMQFVSTVASSDPHHGATDTITRMGLFI
ncbi:MAG: DUF58 domain-containing protein [Proteobacteria bacterium]|nr:DUF58 domain-containing protein [Pseudomonadota bacterium]